MLHLAIDVHLSIWC